jgi:flagellar basal-body rod modification protein FlgD
MVDAISSTVSTTSTLAAQTQEASLNKNDFLKLLVAQLKYQDPLKPQDSTEYVSELAQFSSLEQTMGINERLDALTAQTRSQATTDALGMVGKTATVGGSMIHLPANGSSASLSFSLASAASQTTVSILDENGETVRTLDVGAKPAGAVEIAWDGYGNDGNRAPAGTYQVSVDARTAEESVISVSQETTGRVVSISFDQGSPVLTLDNGVSASLSDLLRVESSPVEDVETP